MGAQHSSPEDSDSDESEVDDKPQQCNEDAMEEKLAQLRKDFDAFKANIQNDRWKERKLREDRLTETDGRKHKNRPIAESVEEWKRQAQTWEEEARSLRRQ